MGSAGPARVNVFAWFELLGHPASLSAFKRKTCGPSGRLTLAVAELSPRRSSPPVTMSKRSRLNVFWTGMYPVLLQSPFCVLSAT